MKIALVGYGKMGRAVERIALDRGHEIVCRVDAGEDALIDSTEFRSADVIIEFTTPATAVDVSLRESPLYREQPDGSPGVRRWKRWSMSPRRDSSGPRISP